MQKGAEKLEKKHKTQKCLEYAQLGPCLNHCVERKKEAQLVNENQMEIWVPLTLCIPLEIG